MEATCSWRHLTRAYTRVVPGRPLPTTTMHHGPPPQIPYFFLCSPQQIGAASSTPRYRHVDSQAWRAVSASSVGVTSIDVLPVNTRSQRLAGRYDSECWGLPVNSCTVAQ